MRYFVLACDYDGTLAHEGRVEPATVAALERLRATGRTLLLVTGRELDELLQLFPRHDLFTLIVAENGALLYRPATRETRLLAEPPPTDFVAALRSRGVAPLRVGQVVVATWRPHETTVLETIQRCGLEHQIVFNKEAVMVLPPGVNKASGLQVALAELGFSPHNAVAVGDAENDHALLDSAECAVAVANALPALKEHADLVTDGDHGVGVRELIERLIADDLDSLTARLTRHRILLGTRAGDETVSLSPAVRGVLIAGPSGAGKSTVTAAVLERLIEQRYQCCLIDPEGDYDTFPGLVSLGDSHQAPRVEEVLRLLESPDEQVAVNLLAVPLTDRPAFLASFLPQLQELRARTGRPHWIVLDEAHHVLPPEWEPSLLTLPQKLSGLLLITLYPDRLAPTALAAVDVVIAVGTAPDETLGAFARAVGAAPPAEAPALEPGEVLVWWRRESQPPLRVMVTPAKAERRRHRRKYSEGELLPEERFHFRGPEGKLDLVAQNLVIFLQMAEGVDDETWRHHLRRHDYSHWFRTAIKDPDLADAAERIERRDDLDARASRRLMREELEQRYTLPAS